MGSSSQTQTQSASSSTAPGAAAMPTVSSIISALNPLISSSGLTSPEQTAINQLTSNAQAGNPYAAAEGANANTLLNGGGATSQNGNLTSNLSTLTGTLSPYTDPNYSTVNSPAVQQALQAANAGIGNSVNGQFAAAGRSGSAYNAGTLAANESQADSGIILNQANTDTANRVNAANILYGAGNTTSNAITGNNQTALGNMINGNSAATSALDAANWGPTQAITAQELAKTIPANDLATLSAMGLPLAELFQTSTGNSTTNTTSNPSLLSDITQFASLFGSGNGGTSAANGIGQSASGIGSGVLALLSKLGGP